MQLTLVHNGHHMSGDVVLKAGKVLIQGRSIEFGSYRLDRIIGRGANGVVIHARHRYIDRVVAIKIWLKLRRKDHRDKFEQGMREAQKAVTAHEKKINTVRIYEAGEVGGYFYCVMDYFDGVQLRQWLHEGAAFWARLGLAKELQYAYSTLLHSQIVHGDLHDGNVLVRPAVDRNALRPTDFRIVDFGTSFFKSDENASIRDRRVFNETMGRLLFPFPIHRWLSRMAAVRQGDYVNEIQAVAGYYWTVFWYIDAIVPLLEERIWGTKRISPSVLREYLDYLLKDNNEGFSLDIEVDYLVSQFPTLLTADYFGSGWEWFQRDPDEENYGFSLLSLSRGE
jgi:serine/threonine protein kinase